MRRPQPFAIAIAPLLAVLAVATSPAQTYTFSLVAGNNHTSGYNGDNIPATSAYLQQPAAIAVDSSGNIYIADYDNQRVREVVAANSYILTAAGNGQYGFGGDGFNAPSSTLAGPRGIAIDQNGNVYIADEGNNRIRKISSATHSITTVAGTGAAGYGGDGGPATAGLLNLPAGVAVDMAGNVYVADTGNNRIRKITVATGVITTVAGNGQNGYSGDGGSAVNSTLGSPSAVAVDASGNIFIADTLNVVVRKVSSSGIITTFAGGGISGVFLVKPTGVAVDSAGNVFIADGQHVRKADGSTGAIIAIDSGTNYNPYGVAVDSTGIVYVADYLSNSVEKLSPPVYTIASNPTGLSVTVDNVAVATPHTFTWNYGSTHTLSAANQPGPTGTQYIFSSWAQGGLPNQTITTGALSTYTANFQTQYYLTTTSGANGSISPPSGWYTKGVQATVTAAPNSGFAFAGFSGALTGAANPQTLFMSAPASVSARFGAPATVSLSGLAQGYDGTPKSVSVTTNPAGLAVVVTYNGSTTAPSAPGSYSVLAAISDATYAGSATGTLVITPPSYVISTYAGGATQGNAGDGGPATAAALSAPRNPVIDSSGNLFFIDFGNHVVRKIAAGTGVITTVAGNGTAGYSGDGGPATAARMTPTSIAISSTGNLLIADAGYSLNNSIVRLVSTTTGIITTVLTSSGGGTIFDPNNPNCDTSDPNDPNCYDTPPTYTFGSSVYLALDRNDNLYISDFINRLIAQAAPPAYSSAQVSIGPFGQVPSSSNYLAAPGPLALDPVGNIFILDAGYLKEFSSGTGSVLSGNQSASGLALDSTGNLFVSSNNNVVYRWTQSSGAVTIAGTGTAGFSGDGGAATTATLSSPFGVAVDSQGAIYVADRNNNRIRKVSSAQGAVTIVSSPSALSITVDGTTVTTPQTFFWTPNSTHTLAAANQPGATGTQYVFSSWSQGGSGTQSIVAPSSPTTYGANFGTQYYLTTSATSGGIITPTSGWYDAGNTATVTATPNNGSVFAGFTGALTGTTNPQNLVVIAPLSVSASFKAAATVTLGSLSATYDGAAKFATATTNPAGLSVAFTYNGNSNPPVAAGAYTVVATVNDSNYFGSAAGTLLIAPVSFSNVQFTYDGAAKSAAPFTTVPAGLSLTVTYNGNPALPVNAGAYTVIAAIADPNYTGSSSRLLTIVKSLTVSTGSLLTLAGQGGSTSDGVAATSSALVYPLNVATDSAGNIYFSDLNDQRIRQISASSGIISTVAGLTGRSGYTGDGGLATAATLNGPAGLAFDPGGNLYFADSANKVVRKISAASGTISTVAGTGLCGSGGDGGPASSAPLCSVQSVAFDRNSSLYIADSTHHSVRKVTTGGIISTVAGSPDFGAGYAGDGGPALSARFNSPTAITFDAAGNLFIADNGNYRIRRVDAQTGIVTTVAGVGGVPTSVLPADDGGAALAAQLGSIEGLSVDSTGNIFFSEDIGSNPGSCRIREVVGGSGEILTLAGGFPCAVHALADGPATGAALAFPLGLALDSGGRLLFGELYGRSIRRMILPNPVTVFLGNLMQSYTGTPNPVTVAANPAGLNVTVTYDGNAAVPTIPGTYSVVAAVSDANYAGSGFGTLAITKLTAPVTFSNLTAVYDGTPKPVAVSTNPSGLALSVTYNGSTVFPSAPGSYIVIATVNDAIYAGSAQATLVIARASATVTFGSLAATYDGAAKSITVSTNPPSLNVAVTYNGSSTPPTTAGSYTVVATVSDPNYAGSATGTLIIDKASATVSLNGLSQAFDGTAKPAIAATVPQGLSVSITYNGASSVPSAIGSYTVLAVVNDTNYSGSATGILNITGAAVTLATSPSGLLVSIDGGAPQAAPISRPLGTGPHTISTAGVQTGGPGTQYVFTGWSDSGVLSHAIMVTGPPQTFTASFKTQFQLTTAASPAAGGSLSPASGFYDSGSALTLQASTKAGYAFANFSGGALTGSTSPQSLALNAPANVVANFSALLPSLSATIGTRFDANPGCGPQCQAVRGVLVILTNTGFASATNATVTSVTAITDVAGSGAVSVIQGIPAALGTINPGGLNGSNIYFTWPTTATRVQFKVNYTADGGYSGSTTITTFR